MVRELKIQKNQTILKNTLAETLERQVTQDGKNYHRRLKLSDNTEPPS